MGQKKKKKSSNQQNLNLNPLLRRKKKNEQCYGIEEYWRKDTIMNKRSGKSHIC